MRRLAFGLVIGACALFPAASAAGAPAPAAPADVHASAEFNLRGSNGFSAEFESFEDSVELNVHPSSRHPHRFVVYKAPGEVTASTVAATFGRLGQISFRFQPTKTLDTELPAPGCSGQPWTEKEGFFVGEAVLHGERGYTTIDVHRVKGKVRTSSAWDCPEEPGPIEIPGSLPKRPAAAAGAAEDERREEFGVLRADDGADRSFLALGGEVDGREYALFSAGLRERREGMVIGRGAYLFTTRPHSFAYDHRAGTAVARPPAPFSGHASFVRHGNAKQPGSWRGTLRVSLLGHDPIRLAGGDFEATLNRDPPGD